MVAPALVWGGAILLGLGGGGMVAGREFGREVGEMTARLMPLAVGSVLVYAAYKSVSK